MREPIRGPMCPTRMDEDDRDRIAELHFDNDPQVITELRRDPQIAAYLNRLDDVVARLRALGRM